MPRPPETTISASVSSTFPVCFCTSKSRTEIEKYNAELNVSFPFIAENGSAIYIPRGYFSVVDYDYKSSDIYIILFILTPFFLSIKKAKPPIKGNSAFD